MNIKLFSRTDSGTVAKTIDLYKKEARPYKKTIWMFSVMIPFSHFLYVVLLPLITSFIVQSLIENPDDITTPLWLIGGIIATGVASLMIQHVAFIAFFNHEERMTTRLAERAMNGLLKHSHLFFSNQKVGSLAGDVNTFSRSYLSLMDAIFLQGSAIFVSFITSLIIVAIISPLLLPPLLLLTAFVVVESITSLNKRSSYRNKRKEMQSRLFGSIADVLGNQTLVRMFGRQRYEVNQIIAERRAIERIASDEIDILQRSAEVRQGGLFLFQAITMAVAVYLFTNDLVTIAALIFSVTYLGRVTGAMYNINSIIRTAEQAFLDASKVTEILSNDIEILDKPGARALKVTDARIAIDAIDFSYGDARDEAVFSQLSLLIPDGQSVGLVGRSGGGKSTLTQLLLRYMDVTAGTITIDGQDIVKVTQESLRRQISYVPQDPYLFHRSLRDNITYGNEDASDADIEDAITKAHAKEFIDKLPNGRRHRSSNP